MTTITARKVTSYFQLPTTTINFQFYYKRCTVEHLNFAK